MDGIEYCEPCINNQCLVPAHTQVDGVFACAFHAWVCEDLLAEEAIQAEYDSLPECDVCSDFGLSHKATSERQGFMVCCHCAEEYDKWAREDDEEI